MAGYIPKLPQVDLKTSFETTKYATGLAYNRVGRGLQAAGELTMDVASKPEVQRAALIGAGAVVAVGAVTVGLPVVGFTAAGVKGGSIAAVTQSYIGNVAAGSAFAHLTSAGAAGIGLSTKILLGGTGGWLFSKL